MVTTSMPKTSKPSRNKQSNHDEKKTSPIKANRNVKKEFVKKSPSPVKVEKVKDNYPNRLYTNGSSDGTALAFGKLPVQENKEPYLWPFFNCIVENSSYQESLCIDDIIPLRSDDNEDEKLLNGKGENEKIHDQNPFHTYWYGMCYVHPNAETNTVEWRQRWGANICTMLNHFKDTSHMYKYAFEIEYKGDQAPAPPATNLCGDILPTEEVLKIIEKSFVGTEMEVIMKDDSFLSDYFSEDRLLNVRKFWRKAHPIYPGMAGENVLDTAEVAASVENAFEEELNKLPSLH